MKTLFTEFIANTARKAIVVFAHLITAVRANWQGVEPIQRRRIYYANHRSHGDFVLIWTALPPNLRDRTRPVAGSDYWLKGKLKSFIGQQVFNAVLIDRKSRNDIEGAQIEHNPIQQMAEALEDGYSLILFPEGTRNTTDEQLLPFKSGLFHLLEQVSDVEVVPVWIDNLNHVMPKGEIVPVPLLCSVTFGEPVPVIEGEKKAQYLARATASLLTLAPIEAGAINE